jgi:DNA-binding NtrC family response regulator
MFASKKVIVVDDIPDVLFLATKRLARAGYEPIQASDGLEALRRMVEHPDCRRMVTDFVMPTLGGNYWIRLLEKFCADWSIVVVSSEDIDPGPFTMMPKPVDFENLVTIFEDPR